MKSDKVQLSNSDIKNSGFKPIKSLLVILYVILISLFTGCNKDNVIGGFSNEDREFLQFSLNDTSIYINSDLDTLIMLVSKIREFEVENSCGGCGICICDDYPFLSISFKGIINDSVFSAGYLSANKETPEDLVIAFSIQFLNELYFAHASLFNLKINDDNDTYYEELIVNGIEYSNVYEFTDSYNVDLMDYQIKYSYTKDHGIIKFENDKVRWSRILK